MSTYRSVARLLAALLSTSLLTAGASLAQTTVTSDPPASFTLGNGMQVVVIQDHRTPVVTQMIWYKVGSADETPGKSGLAHFLEHLMFKGTAKHPAGEFSQTVLRVGGNENAFTSVDYTGYFQRVPREQLPTMMEFEADRMTGLILKDENVLPERDVVLEEYNMRVANNPDARLNEQIMAALYLNHPYGRPVIGWHQEIEKLDREDALAFYRRFYAPNNAILVIAGDVDAADIRPLVERTFGTVPAQPAIPARRIRPQEPEPAAPRTVTLADPRVEQPELAALLSGALGDHGGRRRKRGPRRAGAADGQRQQFLSLSRAGGRQAARGQRQRQLFRAPRSTRPSSRSRLRPNPASSFAEVEQVVDGVIADVAQNPLARRGSRAGQDPAHRGGDLRPGQPGDAGALVWRRAHHRACSIEDIRSWPDRIRAVTAEQVRAAAQKWLDKKRSVTGYLIKDTAPPSARRSVRDLSLPSTRSVRPVVTGAALALATVSPSQAAAKIQHLISPGGIEAWFVQDATVPLIAMEYAFAGGAAQDPNGQVRRRQSGRRPARRRLRRSRFQDLP